MDEEKKEPLAEEPAAPVASAEPETPAAPAEPEAPAVEEPKAEDTTAAVEEAAAEVAKTIKSQLSSIETNIKKYVDTTLASFTKSDETKQVKAKMQPATTSITHASVPLKIYSKKDGKSLTIEKEDAKMLGKWFLAVGKNRYDQAEKFYHEIQQKLEPIVEGTDADGGYLVPTVLTNILVDIRDDEVVIRPRATTIDMSGPGNVFEFSQIISQPKMSWSGENVAKGTTSMNFNGGSLTPYKLAGIVPVSMEFLQDSMFQALPMIISQMGRAIAREEEKAFSTGSGSGRPTGFSTYTYATVNCNFALDYRDFTTAWSRLNVTYRNRAAWVMNGRTMGAVLGMLDSNNRPIFQDGGVDPITGAPRRTILGNPILEQNDVASASIWLVDLSAYYIGDKMKMMMEQSNTATVAGVSAFERNLTFLKAEERVDGEMLDTRAGIQMTNTGIA